MASQAPTPIIPQNPLRDVLYSIARQDTPAYVWQWFFRYFAGGPNVFKQEPKDILDNYRALFSMGIALLKNRNYPKFIKNVNTADYTYYFVGDTHGSFEDTYIMIDYFVKVFQANPKVKVVWIGDMVDRNPYDLQNLAFIMSFWILFPDNVYIIRGNHEDASVCSRYGFSQHLYDKTGSRDEFTPVWELVLEFFSKLPIGMYIRSGEKNVFVVHGGIPFDVNNYKPVRLAEIEDQLNCYQKEYFDMDNYTQTILWSDPDPNLMDVPVAPTPRTGRPRFSKRAFEEFMRINHLDVLIRGHQKWQEGYKLIFDNRLVSLFSTSTYDGRKIGEAKFFRLLPSTKIKEFGDEQLGLGKGILSVDMEFLDKQLEKYYNAESVK